MGKTPGPLTRRTFVRLGAAGAAAGAAIGGAAGPAAAGIRRRGTTLRSRVVRGARRRGGYRRLRRVSGEPHLVRTDLGIAAKRGRAGRRRGLSAFVQLSDVHIVDAQSPLRVEFLDRYEDNGDAPSPGFFSSAYRPQEVLTAQVAEAMVRRINRIGRGPVSGRRLAFAVQTGDNSDNSQLNEVRWNIRLLDGGRIRPDSGDRTSYEGVMDGHSDTYDVHYWHPDGTPPGKEPDLPRRDYGFPVVRGLLNAARRPFRAAGLDMPWFTTFGNHDGLVQGNVPAATLDLNAIATGTTKVVALPPGVTGSEVQAALESGSFATLLALMTGPGAATRQVTADPSRRLLARAELVEEHFTTTGRPVGHGFTAQNRADGTAYYAVDRGPVRLVVMDTVNPNGYADGSLDAVQFAWMREVLAASTDQLVVVCSHHTSDTMDNPLLATGGDVTPRVLGGQVVEELLAHDNVIAWVNGHTHTNRVLAHPRDGGGGFWEINTASHVDWPQHARIIEVLDNRDGTLSLFGTLIDHAAPVSYGGRTSSALRLASLARELAANDWQRRDVGLGARSARNVELLVARPAFMG